MSWTRTIGLEKQGLRNLAVLTLICVVGLAPIFAQSKEDEKTITIRGKLQRVAAIGGETTGWAVRLDSEMERSGKRLKSVEISGDRADLSKLENRHIEASGRLVLRRGIERGEWPVLQIVSIKEIVSNL
jgi:hypothetical protein